MDVSSLFANQNSVQYLVDQFMFFEQEPRNRLLDKKDKVNNTIKILSDLDSKLSALQKRTTRMTDEFTNYFAAKKSSSTNEDVLKATATADAALGNHVLTVDRISSSDNRVSNQYTGTDSDFTTYLSDQVFDIEVAHPTDEDPDNRVSISVTVQASVFTGDNESVLTAIKNAVNGAMNQAVVDETITNDERVLASEISEESGKSRLSFMSASSGYTNRMDFGVSAFLDDLNINNAAQTTGTSGGYISDPGTSASTSLLNSKFDLDGLTFYRDSSTVTDALDGVTLKLLNDFSTAETVTVNTDTESVKKEITEFITAYNDSISYLREQTQFNSTTKSRGPLSDDLTYRDIMSDLRNITQGAVTDITFEEYDLLYDIGLEADQQGKLSIIDDDKLTTAIETNSEYVSDIFNGTDGIATKIDEYIEKFVKTGGTISDTKKTLNSEITTIKDRLKLVQSLLDQKEKQLFGEFSKVQETMARLQNQQAYLSIFISG
jgi:flagellar hook-associated protein 2